MGDAEDADVFDIALTLKVLKKLTVTFQLHGLAFRPVVAGSRFGSGPMRGKACRV